MKIGKCILEIKTHISQLQSSTTAVKSFAELLIVNGNIITLSPIPLHQKIGKAIVLAGDELNVLTSIKNTIKDHMSESVKYFEKNTQEGKLGIYSQFFSDFAFDDFTDKQISTDSQLTKVMYNNVKKEVSKYISEITEAHEEGRVDRFSNAGNDWDIGDSYQIIQTNQTNGSLFNSISSLVENYISDGKDKNDESENNFNEFHEKSFSDLAERIMVLTGNFEKRKLKRKLYI